MYCSYCISCSWYQKNSSLSRSLPRNGLVFFLTARKLMQKEEEQVILNSITRLESENPDVAATSLPVRLTYWTNEYTNNKAEVDNAILLLNGESTTPNGRQSLQPNCGGIRNSNSITFIIKREHPKGCFFLLYNNK